MDEFINSIKSQTINLDNLDSACTLFNIPFLFWYKNAKRSSWDHFMPPSILKSAFFKALMDFPLLAGYIKTDSTGSSCIEIDSGNLNMPEYTDTDCDVDFETLQDSGYNTKMLSSIFADKCISPAPPGLYGGFIKMITANVLRLKDYSGVVLFIGIAHCAVDGYGYCGFINRWAEIAKWMQHSSTVGLLIPERTFIHDRSIHYTGTYSHCDKLENSVQKVMTSGSFLSRWIAWISPESQGRLFKGMSILANCKGLYFHITADVLKTLRESVKKCAAPNASQYSDNDILSALIVMTIGQSMRKIADEKQNKAVAKAFSSLFGIKSGSAEDIMTMVAVDMRPRLNCCGVMDFMGNLAFSRNITTLQDTLQMENTYESLAMIASSIRQIVDSTSKEYVSQYKYMYNRETDCYMRHTLHNIKHRNKILISSHTRFSYYKVDFGSGIPTKVRPMLYAFPNIIIVMPCYPGVNGYELSFSLTKDMADKVLQNELWMGLVDNVDYNI